MSIVDKFKNLTREKKIIVAALAAVVVAAVVIVCIIISNNRYLAKTMRLLRVEGTVNIEDSRGGSKSVANNLRFQSGDALNTGADGLASVGLDATKIVTLQNDSRAEFFKSGKKLELKLTKGALFFNVTEKLKADETFEIKTSTMTAGIRGTSGIVYFDETDENRESLIVTDGVVEVSATNKKTGVTKTARVEAGEKLKVYLFDDETPDNSVRFELDKVPLDELGNFNFAGLADDDALMQRISEHTGWDKEKLKRVLRDLKNNAADPTATPEPTPAETSEDPTPTLSPTPVPTDSPTPSPLPTATPKPKPTATPKPKSKATSTPTPTVEPTTDPSSDPSTEDSTDPSSNQSSQSDEPSVPEGYGKVVWGETYNNSKVYIVGINNEEFMGWINGDWVTLDQAVEEGASSLTTFYYTDDGTVYFKIAESWPANNPPVNDGDGTGYVG